MDLFSKQCFKCKQFLPFDSFHADNRAADKLQRWCKACQRTRRENLPYQKQEQIRQKDRESRARRERERQAVCSKCGDSYTGTKCKKCKALYMRSWMEKNRDHYRVEQARRHREKKQDPQYMQGRRERSNKHRQKIKEEVFSRLGNKCYCCGLDDVRFLTIEHLNNDGAKYRHPSGKRLAGVWAYRWIVENNFPADIVLACYNCNMARQHSGKGVACPHRLDRQQQAA